MTEPIINIDVSTLPELKVCNDWLSDQNALAEIWQQNGYWFFRDVLSQSALANLRESFLDELKEIGVVDRCSDEPLYNDAGMDRYPDLYEAGYEPFVRLVNARPWVRFVADPEVNRFFTGLLGGEPQWVPVAESRLLPPLESPELQRWMYPHQDGFYNEGYDGLTCWIPVWNIPREMGGLAVAEGMHRHGYFHDLENPPKFPIRQGAILDTSWRTIDYRPGDILIFDRMLPHCGLRNHSPQHFRLSVDIRCVRPGQPCPVVGNIVTIDSTAVTVEQDNGSRKTFNLNDDSYCRGVGINRGKRLLLSEVEHEYRPGQEVMITLSGNTVRLLREPKY